MNRNARLALIVIGLIIAAPSLRAQVTLGAACSTSGSITIQPNQIVYCTGSVWAIGEQVTSGGLHGFGNTSPGALVDIGAAGTTLGTLRLEGSTSGYVQLQTNVAAGSWTMTLPTSGGTSGYVLSTDGSGTTSWIASGSSTAINLGTSATATNPSRTSTTNTGLFSGATSTVAVSVGGTQQLTVNTTGVGIGSTSPDAHLTVYDSGTSGNLVMADFFSGNGTGGQILLSPQTGGGNQMFLNTLSATSGLQNWIAYRFGNANNKWFFGDDGTDAYFQTYHPMYFAVNSGAPSTSLTTSMVVTSSGVGLGNTSPGALLDIGKAGTTLGTMRLEGSTSGYVQLQSATAAGSWTMTLPTSGGTSGYVLSTDGSGTTSWISSGSGSSSLGTSAAATSPSRSGQASTGLFSSASNAVAVAVGGTAELTANTTGVGIGTTNPAGQLQVGAGSGQSGWALNVTPSGGTASQTAYFQDTTASTGKTKVVIQSGAGNSYGDYPFEVKNSSGTDIIFVDTSNNWLGANQVIATGSTLNLLSNQGPAGIGTSAYIGDEFTRYATSGLNTALTIGGTFSPNVSSSGVFNTLQISPTINQTGGASGVTRGLYIAPTITSAAGWRALETTVGDVIFGSTSGNVGIGTTSPGYTLTVNGQAVATSFMPSSDERLKKNILTLDGALERISKLRGVSFDWRSPDERQIGQTLSLPTEAHQIGVIAQEVETVYPEVVGTDNNGVKNVNYNALVGPLIEAVKELHRQLKAQQTTIEALQRQIEDLNRRLTPSGIPASSPPPYSAAPSDFPTGRNGGRLPAQ